MADALRAIGARRPRLAVRRGTPLGRGRPGRSDSALIRGVRLRLLLWSGGSTLVVLVVLGTVLYAAVARSLADTSIAQLMDRTKLLARGVVLAGMPYPPGPNVFVTDVASAPGLVIGGPTSGTLAVLIPPATFQEPLPRTTGLADRLQEGVDPVAVDAARAGASSVTEITFAGTPIRVLSTPVDVPIGRFVTQVAADRTAELQTLRVLLVVLLLGGLVAVAVALGVGWLYAERALVPIRDAMRRQREFAADASHELRTPLSVVKASVELLRRHRHAPAATVGTALTDIDSEVDRLTAIVDELLLLARTDSGSVELDRRPADLAEVVLDSAGPLTTLASRSGVRLVVDAAPARLEVDAARIRQLLTILVDNAVRHTPSGGEIRVTVEPVEGAHLLRVDDTGQGIQPEHLPHVFDRFWRAPDAPPGGTGLGLSIAAWIAERHGGSISAADRPEGGARFEVRFPAA
jgi:signal transduction histidine kinase